MHHFQTTPVFFEEENNVLDDKANLSNTAEPQPRGIGTRIRVTDGSVTLTGQQVFSRDWVNYLKINEELRPDWQALCLHILQRMAAKNFS